MAISVFQLFKIGIGPSSSHTVGPMKASKWFLEKMTHAKIPLADVRSVSCDLYGSLAMTGKGHSTNKAVILGLMGKEPETVDTDSIDRVLAQVAKAGSIALLGQHPIPFTEKEHLRYVKSKRLPFHSNGMKLTALGDNNTELFSDTFYSVGGGFIVDEATATNPKPPAAAQKVPYPITSGDNLIKVCKEKKISIAELMMENEKTWRPEEKVRSDLLKIWSVMQECVQRGCRTEGVLPGPLRVKRRAPGLYNELHSKSSNFVDPMHYMDWANLYALAVNEENAAGGKVVTAPTNGAAGIIPAVMHFYDRFYAHRFPGGVVDFLLTAGAVGILYKQGASISGAEMGCQGEVGVAASMAAAGLAAALRGTPEQIEHAAEVAMEHNLGLTCDPIGGLVQIPCIERNTMGTIKAINATALAIRGDGAHIISLDRIIRVMKRTGDDMKAKYKETSRGGLALEFADLQKSPAFFPEC